MKIILVIKHLIWCIFIVFTNCDPLDFLLKNNITIQKLFKDLPICYILPIQQSYNLNCYKNYSQLGLYHEHNHDLLIHDFLKEKYHRTTRVHTSESIFFLPVYTSDCYGYNAKQPFSWKNLEKDVAIIADQVENFVADRTFVSSSFPHSIPSAAYGKLRYVYDLRYIRVDNAFTANGRDVYVPYVVDDEVLVEMININRTQFLFAPCRPSAGKLDESRNWREKAFEGLRHLPNSSVVRNIDEVSFQRAMKSHLFCAIIPGDTGSSSKLYKAIFYGCIPIVFYSSLTHLPFNRFLDWTSFSVLIPKEQLNSRVLLNRTISSLMQIDYQRIRRYQRNLQIVAPLFRWSNSNWPSLYHFMLLEVAIF